MDGIEDITRVAHEAARKWFDDGVPACWQHPWEELDAGEKNFLLVLAEDIIINPDMTPIKDDLKSARQIFIEGVFWGTVRIRHAIKEGETK